MEENTKKKIECGKDGGGKEIASKKEEVGIEKWKS